MSTVNDFFMRQRQQRHHLVRRNPLSLSSMGAAMSPFVHQVCNVQLEDGMLAEGYQHLSEDSKSAAAAGFIVAKRKRAARSQFSNKRDCHHGSRTNEDVARLQSLQTSESDDASRHFSNTEFSPPSSPGPDCAEVPEPPRRNKKPPQFRNLSGPTRETIRLKATSFLMANWPVNKVSSLIQKQFECRVSQRTLYNWKSQALGDQPEVPSLEDTLDSPLTEASPAPRGRETPESHSPYTTSSGSSGRRRANNSSSDGYESESSYTSDSTSPDTMPTHALDIPCAEAHPAKYSLGSSVASAMRASMVHAAYNMRGSGTPVSNPPVHGYNYNDYNNNRYENAQYTHTNAQYTHTNAQYTHAKVGYSNTDYEQRLREHYEQRLREHADDYSNINAVTNADYNAALQRFADDQAALPRFAYEEPLAQEAAPRVGSALLRPLTRASMSQEYSVLCGGSDLIACESAMSPLALGTGLIGNIPSMSLADDAD